MAIEHKLIRKVKITSMYAVTVSVRDINEQLGV